MSKRNKNILTVEEKAIAENVAREVYAKMQENPGMTLKAATGISDEVLEEIYHLAYSYYNQGRYEEGAALFQFLSGAAPNTYKYVLGLAACYHQTGSFEQAALGFYIALNIEPANPTPAYYVTDCFLKQNLNEEALEFAELTVAICEGKPEHDALAQRCRLIADSLKNKNNNLDS